MKHNTDSIVTHTFQKFRMGMLEIVLALVVVILGIVGLIGILPVGLEQHQDAIGTSMAVDAAEQFLHFNASKINEDWSYLDAFPADKPAGEDTQLTWSSTSLIGSTHVNIKFPASNVDESFDPSTHGSGIFLLEQLGTGSDGASFVEFGAVLRMWKSDFEQFEDGSAKATLCVEVSWAAEKPYDIRQKEVFCLEVYKSPSATVQTSASPCVGTSVPFPSEALPEFNITACCPYYEIVAADEAASEGTINLTYFWTDGTSTAFNDLNQMEGRWDALGNWITEGKVFNRTNDTDAAVDWETFVLDYTCSVLIRATPGPDNVSPSLVGGTVFPSGVVPALKNGTRTFTITPDTDYAIADVVVDGSSVGALPVYIFTDVGESHHTITATFAFVGNQAPIANNDTYETEENEPLMLNAPGLISNDQDMDETDTIAIVVDSINEPANGDIQVFPNGAFTYAPPMGWSGTDSFTYRVTDGKDESNDGTVTITVIDTNTPPVAADDSGSAGFETMTTIEVLSNDNDDNGDELTVSGVDTTGTNGTAVITEDNTITFTPASGFSGTTTFTYTNNDGSVDSEPATVTITVEAQPDDGCSGTAGSVTTYDFHSNHGGAEVQITCSTVKVRLKAGNNGTTRDYDQIRFDGPGDDVYSDFSTNGTDWVEVSIPAEAKPLGRVKLYRTGNNWKGWANNDAVCLPDPYQAPVFSSTEFTFSKSFTVDTYAKQRFDSMGASYPSGYALSYTVSPSSWLTVSANSAGTRFYLEGTPTADAGGKWNQFTVTASDGCESISAALNVFVVTTTGNNCPRWKLQVCDTIPEKMVNQYFCVNLPSACKWVEPDGDDLTFTLTSLTDGGDYMYWTNNNQIAGTPSAAGTYEYELTVSDGTCSDTATFVVPVLPEPGQECPVWPQTVQVIDDKTVGEYFCVNPPGGKATDTNPDDTLTYTLVQTGGGPAGATPDIYYITNNLQVAGTPTAQGTFTYTLTVSDGTCEVDADLTIIVNQGNECPEWPQADQTISDQVVGAYFCVDPPGGKATDAETSSNSLNYTLTQTGGGAGGDFVYVSSNRQIAGTPTTAGTFTYILTAADDWCSVTANLTIEVEGPAGPCGPRFNPGNSDWQFCLVTPSGTFNRDDLHDDSSFEYAGPATSAFFKPTAGGGNATVNGQDYALENGKYYLFSGNLTVDVSSSHAGSMGHWEICIEADAEPEFGSGGNRPESPCE